MNNEPATWKRLVIPHNSSILNTQKKREELFKWAVQNKIDAVVFPFYTTQAIAEEAYSFDLVPEAGGWCMSLLVPRKLFLFHKDLFRMEGGKRQKKIHFCPTNPETIAILREEGKKVFGALQKLQCFHLWPDEGEEETWCSCPTCRAFTRPEQNRIAVNAVADVLLEINPKAALSIYEETDNDSEIKLRPNVSRINRESIVTSK